MTDTPTAEEIAQHYTAMGHSVDLLNAGNQRTWTMPIGLTLCHAT